MFTTMKLQFFCDRFLCYHWHSETKGRELEIIMSVRCYGYPLLMILTLFFSFMNKISTLYTKPNILPKEQGVTLNVWFQSVQINDFLPSYVLITWLLQILLNMQFAILSMGAHSSDWDVYVQDRGWKGNWINH